ncbi:MAG: hypothetical protein HY722_12780 [Planctomycetes bacterium]|nr:hypothetical protein [Planctomycetota bacterium]
MGLDACLPGVTRARGIPPAPVHKDLARRALGRELRPDLDPMAAQAVVRVLGGMALGGAR